MTIKNSIKDLLTKQRSFIKNVLILFEGNFMKILFYALIYTVICPLLTASLINLGLKIGLSTIKTTYLSPDLVSTFASSPTTILSSIIILIVCSIVPLFEISALLHAFSMARIGKTTSLSGMFNSTIRTIRQSFKPKNWWIILYLIILLPLTNIIALSNSYMQFFVPGFVQDAINANGIYSLIFYAVYILAILLEITLIFAPYFFVLEETDFIDACKKSYELIKGRYLKTVLYMILSTAIFYFFIVGLSGILSDIVMNIMTFFNDAGTITLTYRYAIYNTLIKEIVFSVLNPIVNMAILTALFYEYIDEDSKLLELSRYAFNDEPFSLKKALLFIIPVFFFAGLELHDINSIVFKNNDLLKRPEIVAHRGDSVRAPENTMPAFEFARLENADWIELDVGETKDGILVVSHDDSLKRVVGKDLYIHDLTYEETQAFDIGSRFDEQYSYVRYSTLLEVLESIKDSDMKVQIEIKPTAYSKHMEESVADIINKTDMKDRTMVICLDIKPLLKIKEIDNEINTAYCMYVAWNHIEDIDTVDHYTIEERNIDLKMVEAVHSKGKKIFAWTVNNEDNIQYLIDCGVDGIVTDDPIMMDNVLDLCQYSNGIFRALRILTYRIINGYSMT